MSWSDPGAGTAGTARTGGHPQVEATVRLLHRRRGWLWTAAGSLLALVVFAVIGSHLWADASGALGAVSGLVVLALLVLAVSGLVVAVIDTVRLRRRDTAVRDQAQARIVHHPVIAHAYRYPARHRVSGWAARVFLLACLVLAIVFLPGQVNAVAFLTGAGGTATFFPGSYGQNCGRSGCTTVTDGMLVRNGHGVAATWPGQVALGFPFTVRAPVWDGWGGPVTLTGSSAAAVVTIIVGLFLDAFGCLAFIALFVQVRHQLRRRKAGPGLLT